jgi:putative chitinase
MIHRGYFFDSVAFYLDSTQALSQDQVDGLEVLLAEADAAGIEGAAAVDDRMVAYILATAWHETAFTCQPIAEYGKGQGKSYGVPAGPYGQCYYGRGFVQLTWYENYVAQDQKLGLNDELVKRPDLALEPAIATKILFGGMRDGDFTGKKLADYFTDALTDWYNARRIVNATDQASAIANYGEKFLNALSHTFGPPRAAEESGS